HIVVVGVPKTIDNDLEGIDHCPGFGSSAKYIAASLLELERECLVYDTKYVMIVEMMGRNAGWLTAAAALSAEKGSIPYLIYLEEQSFSKEQFQKDVEKALQQSDQVMVAVSEGIKDSNGKFLYTYGREEGNKDAFGHSIAGGAGAVLEQMILEKMSVKTRSIEFNLLQRCAGHLLSKTDVEESFLLGAQAVELAVLGENGKMSSLRRKTSGENSFVGQSEENSFEKSSGRKDSENSNAGKSCKAGSGYAVEYSAVPLSEVANREKKIPLSWIGKDGHSLEEEALSYLRPLILGEYSCDFVDGLPQYISFFEKSGK
ncbi:MAG: 6-phosphofructokinase, partial [Oribacterium parvum]|nr:6-phosphofructokinase [Oribacterium parvum]